MVEECSLVRRGLSSEEKKQKRRSSNQDMLLKKCMYLDVHEFCHRPNSRIIMVHHFSFFDFPI